VGRGGPALATVQHVTGQVPHEHWHRARWPARGSKRGSVRALLPAVSGNFDASMEVFEVDDAAQGAVLGESGSKAAPPVFAIEKHYDAEALWFHITKLVHPILTRVGLVAKFIGDDSDGGGATPCRCEGWARAVE